MNTLAFPITEENGIIVKTPGKNGDKWYRVKQVLDSDTADSPRSWDGNLGKMVCWHSQYKLGDEHDYETPGAFLRGLLLDTLMTPRYFGGPVIEYIEDGKAKNIRFDDNDEEHEGCRVIVGKNEDDEDIEENWVYVNDIAWPSDTPADRTWLASQCIEWLTMGEVNEILSTMQVCILPVYLLDHGGLAMSTSDFNDPWDSGQVGYIYTTIDRAKELWGHEPDKETWQTRARKEMKAEVDVYDQYLRGEVYGVVIESYVGSLSELGISEDYDDSDSCWNFYDNDGMLEYVQECLGDDIYVPSDEEIQAVRETAAKDEAKQKERASCKLWDTLLAHCGHHVSIVCYGDSDDPENVALECENCGEVILDAGLYTLAARDL